MASLGRVVPKTSALLLCDMQQKFAPNIAYFKEIVSASNRVLRAADVMGFGAVIATEQYPKGLGKTVAELELDRFGVKPLEKTAFSMTKAEGFNELLPADVKSVVLCGIETHACIFHTVLELRDSRPDLDVHVVLDCCSSRSMLDRKTAFKRIEAMGAFMTTSETLILGLAADAAHPNFKQLQKLVMTPTHDTGLA